MAAPFNCQKLVLEQPAPAPVTIPLVTLTQLEFVNDVTALVPLTDILLPPLKLKLIFPVVAEPSVRVCLLVVPIFPSPSTERAFAPELAEIEATGVPPALLRNPNLALEVDVPPSRRSSVML